MLSFWNEAEVIPELVRRLRETLGAEREAGRLSRYELVFVNDASTDGSRELLLELAAGHDDLRILTMSRKFGVSPCVLAGMEHSSGDAVVYMDADLQDPPEVLPDLIRAWQTEQADVVHTVRLSRAGESRLKLLITRIGYLILRKVTSIKLPVEAGDFKLLSRRVVDRLIEMREKKPFVRGMVHWVGFKQTQVEYHRLKRAGGETKFPVLGLPVIRNFFESALISFSSFPLQISSCAGLLSSLVGAGVLIHVLIEKIRGHNIPGWTALMAAILFLGSIQLFSLGIMGLYLNAVYEETKGRPNYIVERTDGFPDEENRGP